MKIALLHPQCETQGGAIKMALLSADLLEKAGHEVVLYTFLYSPKCFSMLQKNIVIVHHDPAKRIIFSPFKKLINIITLAWRVRHVDIVIANNPPMQIVAVLAKAFSLWSVMTIWWHHHTPWYFCGKDSKGLVPTITKQLKMTCSGIFWKGIFEKIFIIPYIDSMVATSQFVAEKIQQYCQREATVIHPILDKNFSSISSFQTESKQELNNGENFLLFTHGRLEPGKGLETIVSIFEKINKENKNIHLTLYGTGSLENSLKSRGIDVQPFDIETTLRQIASNNQPTLAIYASTIDAFGMAPLEAQSTGISTLILDRGGARETLLSDMSGEPVARLVDSEEDLYSTVSYFIAHKKFPKDMSIVNFFHTIEYFSPERLSSDLLFLINKTKQKKSPEISL